MSEKKPIVVLSFPEDKVVIVKKNDGVTIIKVYDVEPEQFNSSF